MVIKSVYEPRKSSRKKKPTTTDFKRLREELSRVKDKDLRRDLAEGEN